MRRFYREIWAICIVGVIYLADYVKPNKFNFVSFILHGSIWNIPSKLNFAAYCVHFQVILLYAADYEMFGTVLGGWSFAMQCANVVMLSYLVAMIWYLCIEVPVCVQVIFYPER